MGFGFGGGLLASRSRIHCRRARRSCPRRTCVRVGGSGCRVHHLGLEVGFRVHGFEFRVLGAGIRVWGLGCRVQGAECRA